MQLVSSNAHEIKLVDATLAAKENNKPNIIFEKLQAEIIIINMVLKMQLISII